MEQLTLVIRTGKPAVVKRQFTVEGVENGPRIGILDERRNVSHFLADQEVRATSGNFGIAPANGREAQIGIELPHPVGGRLSEVAKPLFAFGKRGFTEF